MASEGNDHKRCMEKKLFGVPLYQPCTDFSHGHHPLKAPLGVETPANNEDAHVVPELEDSASKGRIYLCRYCSRKFSNPKALGGHQNAHKKERTASKSNPIVSSEPSDCFEYPVVGQQQPTSDAMFASNGTISRNFEWKRENVSSNQPHFDQCPRSFQMEFEPVSLPSLKRARNDMELASSSLPSVKRATNEDPQQGKTTPGRMDTLTTQDGELNLSLHL